MKSSKNNYLFEILDDIKFKKTGILLDKEEYISAFNPFIINKFLSMDNELCEIINIISIYSQVLSKEQYYKLLVNIIPLTNKRVGYVSSIKNDLSLSTHIAEYYQCSQREAKKYIQDYGEEWAKNIQEQFGGIKK